MDIKRVIYYCFTVIWNNSKSQILLTLKLGFLAYWALKLGLKPIKDFINYYFPSNVAFQIFQKLSIKLNWVAISLKPYNLKIIKYDIPLQSPNATRPKFLY